MYRLFNSASWVCGLRTTLFPVVGGESSPTSGVSSTVSDQYLIKSHGFTTYTYIFMTPSLEIFWQHEFQIGFSLNKSRIIDAIDFGPSSSVFPHPALLNAMYLWGARFSRNNLLSSPQIERAFYERATGLLQSELEGQTPQRGLQVVQTEVLLATYLFVFGRNLETEYHVSAAVRLALSYGMHRIVPQTPGLPASAIRSAPVDTVEEGERITVFWRVFLLDHAWAIANNKPASIRVDGSSSIVITTPWPLSAAEYEQVHFSLIILLHWF